TTTGAKADGLHLQNPDDGVIAYSTGSTSGHIGFTSKTGGFPSVSAPVGGGSGPGVFAEGVGAVTEVAAAGPTHDLFVTPGTVKVTGDGSNGIWAKGVGAVTVDAGVTSAVSGNAIDVTARNLGSVTVRGSATSAQGLGVALTGADAQLTLAAGAH